MFFHNFKYSLKILLKNKMLIFWTFIFPLVMGTFFYLAFSNIENSEKLNIIDIAVIDNDYLKNNEMFKNSLDELSKKGDKQLFNTKYTSTDEAKKLLKENEITGYVLLDKNGINIKVNENGVNETILRSVVDEIDSNITTINAITTKEIEKSYQNGDTKLNYEDIILHVKSLINENDVKLNNISNSNLSYTMIEYYTLIAMSCLYGGILAMFITNYRLANMCGVGKRSSITPIKKKSMILGSLFASYIIQLVGVLLLFVYTIFVLHVDYGSNLLNTIILALVGSLAGLSIGVFIASLFKTHENAKMGILIAFTMLGCFLSGMMGITMKYVIDKNIPIINKINPASLITDGLYSLYYYDTSDRYYSNIICLLIFSGILILISILALRRQKYDNI